MSLIASPRLPHKHDCPTGSDMRSRTHIGFGRDLIGVTFTDVSALPTGLHQPPTNTRTHMHTCTHPHIVTSYLHVSLLFAGMQIPRMERDSVVRHVGGSIHCTDRHAVRRARVRGRGHWDCRKRAPEPEDVLRRVAPQGMAVSRDAGMARGDRQPGQLCFSCLATRR